RGAAAGPRRPRHRTGTRDSHGGLPAFPDHHEERRVNTTTVTRRAPATIDPRLRARRTAVRRDEGRRRLRRLVGLVAVCAILAGGYLITRSPLLDVDQVRVEGAHRTGAEQLLDATGLRTGEPMTDIDIGSAE